MADKKVMLKALAKSRGIVSTAAESANKSSIIVCHFQAFAPKSDPLKKNFTIAKSIASPIVWSFDPSLSPRDRNMIKVRRIAMEKAPVIPKYPFIPSSMFFIA